MFALDAKIGLLDVSLDQRAAEVRCPGLARFGEIVGKGIRSRKVFRQRQVVSFSHSPCRFCE
jgi:hypothetical protein